MHFVGVSKCEWNFHSHSCIYYMYMCIRRHSEFLSRHSKLLSMSDSIVRTCIWVTSGSAKIWILSVHTHNFTTPNIGNINGCITKCCSSLRVQFTLSKLVTLTLYSNYYSKISILMEYAKFQIQSPSFFKIFSWNFHSYSCIHRHSEFLSMSDSNVSIPHSGWITSDRNEIWAQDLYHSTASHWSGQKFSILECHRTWLGTVPETSAKVCGTCCTSAQRHIHRNVLVQCAVTTQRERSIVDINW